MTAPKNVITPWPQRPVRLGIAVVEHLVDSIVSGNFPPGSSIPIEPDLCGSFGVSRSVVREAVKMLESKGLVRVRQGQGTTVADPDEWNLLDPLVLAATVRQDESLDVIEQLVDVRATLEARLAHEAAVHATDDQLAEIGALLDRMTTLQHDPSSYFQQDVPFHDLIMRASRNRLGRSIVGAIQKEASPSPLYQGNPAVRHVRRAHAGHGRIYQMLVDRDAEGASTAMHEHIISGWRARKKTVVTSPRNAD